MTIFEIQKGLFGNFPHLLHTLVMFILSSIFRYSNMSIKVSTGRSRMEYWWDIESVTCDLDDSDILLNYSLMNHQFLFFMTARLVLLNFLLQTFVAITDNSFFFLTLCEDDEISIFIRIFLSFFAMFTTWWLADDWLWFFTLSNLFFYSLGFL